MTDRSHMQAALNLARRGLGQVWPNPAVGCVLVKDSVVVARGWTQAGGRPHAESEALRRAGPAARGASAYVEKPFDALALVETVNTLAREDAARA